MRTLVASAIAVGLGFVTALTVKADDSYTFKLYKSKKGDKTENVRKESYKTNVIVDIDGTKSKENTTSGSHEVYSDEILEMNERGRATKLIRHFTVAETTQKGENTTAVYAGKSVLIELKGDKFEFSVDGKMLGEDEAPELFKRYNEKKSDEPKTDDFLPSVAVKVGDGWKVLDDKCEMVFKAIGEQKMKFDTKKSSIEGKLLKAYKKGDAQFGIVELNMTMFVTEINTGEEFLTTTEDSKLVVNVVLDLCIDGSVEFEHVKMELTPNITIEVPDRGSVLIQGTSTLMSSSVRK